MRRSRVITSRLRERVVVTLKSGASFAGVLFSHDRTALVLREVDALGVNEDKTDLRLDGELIALFADVDYIQRP